MKSLKFGLLILVCGAVLLWLLSSFPITSSSGEQLKAKVIANTLTQSLDGHRRYLTLQASDQEIFRVSVAPATDCPIDSMVTLDTLSNQITGQSSYQFIDCRAAQ